MFKDMIKRVPGIRRIARVLRPTPRKSKQQRRTFVLEMLPKESVGVEIGVHKGDFSQRILDVVQPATVHLIDPWQYESSATYRDAWYGGRATDGQDELDQRYIDVCARFAEEMRIGRVKVHRGSSTDVLSQFPDEYFDWVYIDGNHLYEYVKDDIQLSFRKTKDGGYIAGDDYTDNGWWMGGVKKAVDEVATAAPEQLVEIRNGQFIFRKKGKTCFR